MQTTYILFITARIRRVHHSVSANTGRITVEMAEADAVSSSSLPTADPARCNISTEEFKELLATKGGQAVLTLANTPFEPLLAAPLSSLPPNREELAQSEEVRAGRCWRRCSASSSSGKRCGAGSAKSSPTGADSSCRSPRTCRPSGRAVGEGKGGQCFDRYMPSTGGGSSSSCGSGHPSAVPHNVPAYIPRQPKTPRPALQSSSSSSSFSASSHLQRLECAWCHSKITDPEVLSAIAIQQARDLGRVSGNACASASVSLILRGGASSGGFTAAHDGDDATELH